MLTHKSIACTLRDCADCCCWLKCARTTNARPLKRYINKAPTHTPKRSLGALIFVRRPLCVSPFCAFTLTRARFGSFPSLKSRASRRETAIEKCKHKNKLDVTRSAKRRRREIESFKNEHRKIYLGEKPMAKKTHIHT